MSQFLRRVQADDDSSMGAFTLCDLGAGYWSLEYSLHGTDRWSREHQSKSLEARSSLLSPLVNFLLTRRVDLLSLSKASRSLHSVCKQGMLYRFPCHLREGTRIVAEDEEWWRSWRTAIVLREAHVGESGLFLSLTRTDSKRTGL